MATYLLVTKPENAPERVEFDKIWWSCHSKTEAGDSLLVYITRVGIQYEWRALKRARPDPEWKYACDVEHVRTFHPPITIAEIRRLVRKEDWAPPHQNFHVRGSAVIPAEVAQRIRATRPKPEASGVRDRVAIDRACDAVGSEFNAGTSALVEDVDEIRQRADVPMTTKQAFITARQGQGEFRRKVFELWGNRCCVTGSQTQVAVHAAHIKPWQDSSDPERLDPRNGLPLVASLHALFDAGLIAFDSGGKLLIAEELPARERRVFKLHGQSLRKQPSPQTEVFLDAHRRKHGFEE